MNATHPLVIFAALGAIASMLALRSAWHAEGGPRRAAWIFLAAILLAPLALAIHARYPELIDPRVRAYKEFFTDVEIGMSRAEFVSLIERHYPPSGPRRAPRVIVDEPARLSLLMDPEGTRSPNAEGISVTFREGMVVAKHYSPD